MSGAVLTLAAIFLQLAGPSNRPQGETRQTEFKEINPVVLNVGVWESSGSLRALSVVTNSRTKVGVRHTGFLRYERDWEGRPLETFDAIPAKLRIAFFEIVSHESGARLEVRRTSDSAWCVNPHRGGYRIVLQLLPGPAEIWDDAGCYVATATVVITAEPFNECGGILPPDGKGNNGVGNGEDPQPPGDPPVNDGPGTGPGDPGRKGGGK